MHVPAQAAPVLVKTLWSLLPLLAGKQYKVVYQKMFTRWACTEQGVVVLHSKKSLL